MKNAPPRKTPVHSMTGYARVTGRIADHLVWNLGLKSVNHRFLDLHMRMPGGSEPLEMQLRRLLKEKVIRGHLEMTLTFDRSARQSVQLDGALMEAYIAAFREAAAANALVQEPDLNVLLRMPGVVGGDPRTSEDEMKALEETVLARVEDLIHSLNTMRAQEGEALAAILEAGMQRLASLVAEAGHLRREIQPAYYEHIERRVRSLLEAAVDRDRVLQEAAMLAERSDVEEEIARLHAHIDHFRSMLEAGGEVGKRLDFLLQEMNREANTLLSKTGGIAGNGQRLTEIGLAMKAEIEKAREQVQNLE